jgi:hypothetical protein
VRILASVKDAWNSRVTTVFPRQGHYAMDEKEVVKYRPPDLTIEHIAALLDYDLSTLISAASSSSTD